MSQCHTSRMGVHLYRCNDLACNTEKLQYHCCGNRHCPNCGSMKKEAWIEERMNELLPTPYYHVVFTLPHEWNSLILGNRKAMFKTLFDAASETLLNYSQKEEFLGAQSGITMVLHTWGQALDFHPHVHCIVSGGGYADGKWIPAKRAKNNFLFPQAGLSKMYKAIFLKKVRAAKDLRTEGINMPSLLCETEKKDWNVYAKAPFGSPAQVVEYLGRYTHKIAISKHRIVEVNETSVRFGYKDYADGNKTKEMTLEKEEFLLRFEKHILPRGFVKIRHYGYLQNRGKHERLGQIRESMKLPPVKPQIKTSVAIRMLTRYGKDIFKCPCCEKGRLILVTTVYPRHSHRLDAELRNKASPQ